VWRWVCPCHRYHHALSWQKALYIAHIPPRCVCVPPRQQKLDFHVFLIQTSLVFNSVIVSTPPESSLESLALITREINANERPNPLPSGRKKNKKKTKSKSIKTDTEREKRENICFPSLAVCISYPHIRPVYLCSRMFSKPPVQRD